MQRQSDDMEADGTRNINPGKDLERGRGEVPFWQRHGLGLVLWQNGRETLESSYITICMVKTGYIPT